jgi:hypothetical protein
MKHLYSLTPAEVLISTRGTKAGLGELLKFTFLDLLLQQVISTSDQEKQSHSHDRSRVYKYVSAGPSYHSYVPKPHEIALLSPFMKNESIEVLFRHFVKMAYQKSGSKGHFQMEVISNTGIAPYFYKNWFQMLFGGISARKTLKTLKKEIESEMKVAEDELNLLTINDPRKAKEIIKSLKGNIFLLRGIDLSRLELIDVDFGKNLKTRDHDDRDTWAGTVDWSGHYGDAGLFDSSCSGDGGSGSGCGGGGCSGCGGCSS